jgi:outer membrane protein insertion porin family
VNYKVSNGSKQNLKIIDISVEEQPTGEIGAGAGIGTSGGTLAFNIKENNWLGEGKALEFEAQIDEESLAGNLIYTNPNYDFLGNSLYYNLSSEKNDKPNQGYENSILSVGAGTSFEQYKDIDVSLSLLASYDDLRTLDTASSSLKKQSGQFSELAAIYGFTNDKRNRAFMPTEGSILSFSQSFPFYADRSFISNTFSASKYHSFSEDVIGTGKLYLKSVNGLNDDDVRLSKRTTMSTKRLRGFERGKIGPVDGVDHIGGNYAAALNFEASLPNLLPENTNMDFGLFLDFGNIWGVDYDASLDKSNKIRFVLAQDLSKADTDVTESFSFNLGTTF